MRRVAVFLVLAGAAALAGCDAQPRESRGSGNGAAEGGWSQLDAQGRCDRALALVTHPDRWPVVCRWRRPGEGLAGQAFPPPVGEPPYEAPRAEVYLDPGQSVEEVARAIAHELGHMHHTREPEFVAEWLAARNLDEGTPPEVWTEDYAEVFATLFAPPSDQWRAPTPRPTPGALAELRSRFFS